MENPEAIANQLYCYACSLSITTCKCPSSKKGQNMQFMLAESLLPPSDASVLTNLNVWASLVSVHILASRFQAKAFLQEYTNPAKKDLLTRLSRAQPRVLELWNTYKNAPIFNDLPSKFNNLWTLEQLQSVGDEAVDSFFTGRWWELHAIGIVFLMNAFETSKMDPKAKENEDLVVIAEVIQAVTAVIVQTCEKPGFTIVAPSSSARMKGMTANAFYNPGGQTYTGIQASCTSQQSASQAIYYDCLCTQSNAIVTCYVNADCSSDPTYVTAKNQQTSYCQAANQLTLTTTAVIPNGIMPTQASVAQPGAPTTASAQLGVTATTAGGNGPALTLASSSVGGNGAASSQTSSSAGAAVSTASHSASGAVKSAVGVLLAALVVMVL
ncbi:hypothetical protein HDU98_003825 [Podochytrium sp. JEL0797]|nr:hypothetical protein HDU98_003825 [Podochytrium sp. JEL0797]